MNGIRLDNPSFNWKFRAPSKPLSEFTHDAQSMTVAGRDGVVVGLPSTIRPPTIPLVVETPKTNLETLIALFGRIGLLAKTTAATREVKYEVLSHSISGFGKADALVDVTFVLRLSGVFWRDKTQSNLTWSVAGASTSVTFWSGMSAPVQDALLRLKGPHLGATIQDPDGSWVSLPPCAASEAIIFRLADGSAGKNTSGGTSWTSNQDVSGSIDFGGPRGIFEITPQVNATNPATRNAQLTVTGGISSGAVLALRGESAYVL